MSVRACRKRLGLSQEKLAERAGLHRTYICDVERGVRNVSLESIEKLARALEVSISTLLACEQGTFSGAALHGLTPPEQWLEILLIEDLADDVELTLRALKQANVSNTIRVLRDGAAALEHLFRAGQDSPPKLILLDLYLPKVDGFEVLRQVKAHPLTRTIPVIILTASTSDSDLATCKKLGADAFIPKPVQFKSLSEVAPKLNLQWALLEPASSALV